MGFPNLRRATKNNCMIDECENETATRGSEDFSNRLIMSSSASQGVSELKSLVYPV